MTGQRDRVLVVDDDPRNTEIVCHLLEELCDFETAMSGEEALAKVPIYRPDLILLDIMMPGIDGYEVCKQVKAEFPSIKIILVSAKAMVEERVQGYEVGADDYLAKPFDHEEFLAKVRVFLKLKRAEDELLSINGLLEDKVKQRTEQCDMARREAETARAYADSILASMIDPLFVLDLDFRIRSVNRAASAVLEYPEEELIGKSFSDLVEKSVPFDAAVKNRELTFLAKSGEAVPVAVSISPMQMGGDGELSATVCLARDLREEKKAQQEKKLMQRQVIQASKLASIGELTSGVAHEINNPLTIIRGNLDFFDEYFTRMGNKDLLPLVKQQEEAIARIVNIVNGLRVYARMDQNKTEQLNVHQVLEQSVSIVENIYRKNNIEIVKELESNVPYVKGSAGRFQQVIMNLLGNAKDALEGVMKPRIRIRTENTGDRIVIYFSDNGSGMPEEVKQRIFEPFFTTKEAGKGTGLGLGIVLSIVNEMGGKIEVDSTLGGGTTFRVSFPLLSVDEMLEEAARPVASTTPEVSGLSFKGKALVVDDERDICQIVSRYLSDAGFEVELAQDGDEAFEMMKKGPFDLLVTDLKMPRMAGDALVDEAKRAGISLSTKIIAITGNDGVGEPTERLIKFKESVDGYIQKPFSKNDLYSAIKDIMQLQ